MTKLVIDQLLDGTIAMQECWTYLQDLTKVMFGKIEF